MHTFISYNESHNSGAVFQLYIVSIRYETWFLTNCNIHSTMYLIFINECMRIHICTYEDEFKMQEMPAVLHFHVYTTGSRYGVIKIYNTLSHHVMHHVEG